MADQTYTSIGNYQKRLVDIGDSTFAEVTTLASMLPTAWSPTDTFNARIYADVEIQVIGAPTTPYIFQDSFDGSNFNDCNVFDKNGVTISTVTAPGRFRLPGACYLKARQGAGSTFYIRAGS